MPAIDRLYNSRLTALVVGLVTALCILRIALILPERSARDDFAHYYIAGKIYLSGQNPYDENLALRYAAHGFIYDGETGYVTAPNPPSFYFLFAPLAMLSPGQAFYAWLSIEILCLIFILWSTQWLLKDELSAKKWMVWCAAIVCSQWVYGHFYHSQAGLFLVVLVQGAFCLHRLAKYTPACLVIVLAGFIKIFPFVLLPWFVLREKKKYKFCAHRIIISTAVVCLLFLLTGVQNWIDYYNFSFRYLLDGSFGIGYNFSLPSFVVNQVYAAYQFKPPPEVIQVWPRIGVAVGLIALALSYWLSFKHLRDLELEFSFLITAMLLSGARTLGHYLVFLIFPIAVAFARATHTASKRPLLILGIIFLALNFLDLSLISFLFTNRHIFLVFNYIPLYGLVGLMVFYVNIILSDKNLN